MSAGAANAADVRAAGEWFVQALHAAGLRNAALHETSLHPVVTASDASAGAGAPTLLLYGHFDVQPGDPFELWTSPPFSAEVRNGTMYARGVSDNKGQILAAVHAAGAMLRAAEALDERPPVNIKVFIEGAEEIGSPGVDEFVRAHAEELAADAVLSTDGTQPPDGGAFMLGLRGLCSLQVDAFGASLDLHSGVYGGVVANPLHAVAYALASLRDPATNEITVPGFYDGVPEPTAEEVADWAASAPDEEAILADIGLPPGHYGGERGRTWAERNWNRPTLEVVGMHGGFQGEGMKTVLPREAHAKVAMRMVPGQDSERVRRLVGDAILEAAGRFAGVDTRVSYPEGGADAYVMPKDCPLNRAAARTLRETYGSEPGWVRWGATVPVTSLFREVLGVYTTTVGFGLDEDKWHSPDEALELERFSMAAGAYLGIYHNFRAVHDEGAAAAAPRDEL